MKLTMSGGIGSPAYMAPELFDEIEGHFGPTIDVYAFAFLAYEIVTGKVPYSELGKINPYILANKVKDGYRPPFSEGTSQKMIDLISKCWSSKIEERPTFSEIYEKISTDFSYFSEKVDTKKIRQFIDKLSLVRIKDKKDSNQIHIEKLEEENKRLQTELSQMKHKYKELKDQFEHFQELSQPFPKSKHILGIDFGTSTTRFGIYNDNKLDDRIIKISLPSTIAFNKKTCEPCFNIWNKTNRIKKGYSAIGHFHSCLNDEPDDFIIINAIKKLLCNEITQETVNSLHFELETTKQKVKITDTVNLFFEQIAALILAEGKRMIEDQVKEDLSDAIICVPGFYNAKQKKSLMDAATIAGFNIIKFITNEKAIITAINTNNGQYLDEKQSFKNFNELYEAIIIEFGAGNIETSIVKFNKNSAIISEILGDTSIGGIDIDKTICELVMTKIPKNIANRIKQSNTAMRLLEKTCETFKIKISSEQVLTNKSAKNDGSDIIGSIDINEIFEDYDLKVQITRKEYEKVLFPFCQRLTDLLKDLFNLNTTKPSEIKQLILVGGIMKEPFIRNIATNFLKNEGYTSFETIYINSKAIMLGTAIQGAISSGYTRINIITIKNTVVHPIGFTLANGTIDIIIPRGKILPFIKSVKTTTLKDNQRNVEFTLVEGSQKMADDNIKIGCFCFRGLAKAPRGIPTIEIKFNFDDEGVLFVEGHEKNTGEKLSLHTVILLENKDLKKILVNSDLTKLENIYKRKQIATKSKLKFYLLQMESKGIELNDKKMLEIIDKYYSWLDENYNVKPSEYDNMYRISKNEIDSYIRLL